MNEKFEPITNRPVLPIINEQIEKFNLTSIHSRKVMDFDVEQTIGKLRQLDGQKVIGADFGGDKGITKLFTVKNCHLIEDTEFTDYVQGDSGDGYLQSLERTAKYADEHKIPVGISWGGPLDGTKPLFHPKVANFLDELKQKYDGDLANVLPNMKMCLNDGPAGAVCGVIEAALIDKIDSAIFAINGGGLGVSVFANNVIYEMEAGHIEGLPELNTYNQNKSCDVFGSKYVCLEILGANKVGIEAQWEQATGSHIRAKEIEDCYRDGNVFAGDLYYHSAYIVAHVAKGVAKTYGIDLTNKKTVLIGHGSAYKFPYYGERIQQTLNMSERGFVKMLMTKDFCNKDSNACLDGAALAALASFTA